MAEYTQAYPLRKVTVGPDSIDPTRFYEVNVNADGSMNMRLTGSKVTETVLWDTYAKRNTTTEKSASVVVDGQVTKRIWYQALLDQAVTITTEISKDGGATWVAAGGPKTIGVSSGFGIVLETDTTLAGLGIIKGLLRISLAAAVAPAAGTLTLVIQTMPV